MNDDELTSCFDDDEEDLFYSTSMGDFTVHKPLPPAREKGRSAQDAELRRFGFDPQDVRRPPIDEVNEAGFLLPDEPADDAANERR
ncbi:MAG: hypothetical protein KC978_19925 [Candidatus Omnitrophica bacterium]|nr:hypothetical protein [Candidatus Omnitrophota bacterium]